VSPFGPLIPPQPCVYFRNQPLNDALPTAHYPLPTFRRPLFSYSYELFVAPKEVKSFAIKQIRTLAQNTGGARVLLRGPFTSHRSRATSHVLSAVCRLFVVSLRSFLHPSPLFSTACSLFSENTRGGGYLCALCGSALQFAVVFRPLRVSPFFSIRAAQSKMEPLNLGTRP
jgi:hypothetical protein